MGGDPSEIVERQLGRKVKNFLRVVRWCSRGKPIVIESLPEKNGKPFPTLYWLTCPHLRREVSRLEEKGLIREFEKKIEMDPSFREELLRAHEEVKRRRRELVKTEWIREVLEKVGSGGVKDLTKVKCLHLHLADFLAGVNNPIGREVWNMIEEKECNDPPKECKEI